MTVEFGKCTDCGTRGYVQICDQCGLPFCENHIETNDDDLEMECTQCQ